MIIELVVYRVSMIFKSVHFRLIHSVYRNILSIFHKNHSFGVVINSFGVVISSLIKLVDHILLYSELPI